MKLPPPPVEIRVASLLRCLDTGSSRPTLKSLLQIHAHVVKSGLEQDHITATKLLCFCNSLSASRHAAETFARVASPNVYLYNTLLKSFSDRNHHQGSSLSETFLLFNRMRSQPGVRPDSFTFPPLLKCCSREAAVIAGASLHGYIITVGIEGDLFVGTGLVDMYGKCGEIRSARRVFDAMLWKNEVSWTAMIVAFLSHGDLCSAREVFSQMPNKKIAAWNAMIDGYAKRGELGIAKEYFNEMPERNVTSFTALIDGFMKAGDVVSARELFDMMKDKDMFSWSAMVSGYVQNGRASEAVKMFFEMQNRGIEPDVFVMVGLISACSQLGSLQLARRVDSYIRHLCINLSSVHVTSALIDMNMKCGNMEGASLLFESLPKKDLISYCSMMQGYSIHGCGAKAVELFCQMIHEGIKPDDTAFTVVLTACRHAGLLEEGYKYFEMLSEYQITPSPDHYAIVVDLLGRFGCLQQAYELIKLMPVKPHAGAWGALLVACKVHGDIELGENVAKKLFELEPLSGGSYVLLSNIYADANKWSEVWDVRNMMRNRGIKKMLGCSWNDGCISEQPILYATQSFWGKGS